MLMIGNMVWRIGRLLDVGRQIAWTRAAGFDGVGLHASAGMPGQWRGVEPSRCGAAQRERLRRELAEFSFAEVHAPFAIELRTENLGLSLVALQPVLQFAGDIGAGVVTVHASLEGAKPAAWLSAMRELDGLCALTRTTVALEVVDGFTAVESWGLPHVGVNLDVGHMHLPGNREVLRRMGGLSGLVRSIGETLVHLHLHDVDGEADHLEIGTGVVDFAGLIGALRDIGYARAVTMEMQPDRVSPAGMRRGLGVLREHTAAQWPDP